jgi:pimeloyl-ACP methyl ester carboxylesterase
MKWVRRLWFTYVDSWLGALWGVFHRPGPGEPESLATGDRAPVLLIPGVYESWRYLLPTGRRLHAAGHPVHVLSELRHNRGPIPDAAALAQRRLDELGLTGVVVVAHSKGGLIGKHMMAVDDTAGRIGRMVAVATPFSGSSLARYAPVRTLRVFRPEGRMLSALAQNYALNARITSIFSEFDPVIPGGSELDGATNVRLPVVGHFRILRDPRVLDAILAAVDPE